MNIRNGYKTLVGYNSLFQEPLDEKEVKTVFNNKKDHKYKHDKYKPYCQNCGEYYLKTGEFEVYIPRISYQRESRTLIYPSRFEDKKLTPMMHQD